VEGDRNGSLPAIVVDAFDEQVQHLGLLAWREALPYGVEQRQRPGDFTLVNQLGSKGDEFLAHLRRPLLGRADAVLDVGHAVNDHIVTGLAHQLAEFRVVPPQIAFQATLLNFEFRDTLAGLLAHLANGLGHEARVLADGPHLVDHELLDLQGGDGLRGAVVPAAFLGVEADVVSIPLVRLLGVRMHHRAAAGPSCIHCVEKHLGAAYVLLDETRESYAYRRRAIGHLFEAEDESQQWPVLHAAIWEARKAYQGGGPMPDWEALGQLVDREC